MAPQDVSHYSLLSQIPTICLSIIKSSPRPGIAPQSLNSSSQSLCLPGHLWPVWSMYGCLKDYLILILFRLPQISCFTLSFKCFSSDSDNCPDVVIGPLLQFPHPTRASSVLLTLLFSPRFLHPAEFFMDPYILFRWSSTLVYSQLVFSIHFCV